MILAHKLVVTTVALPVTWPYHKTVLLGLIFRLERFEWYCISKDAKSQIFIERRFCGWETIRTSIPVTITEFAISSQLMWRICYGRWITGPSHSSGRPPSHTFQVTVTNRTWYCSSNWPGSLILGYIVVRLNSYTRHTAGHFLGLTVFCGQELSLSFRWLTSVPIYRNSNVTCIIREISQLLFLRLLACLTYTHIKQSYPCITQHRPNLNITGCPDFRYVRLNFNIKSIRSVSYP